jgi:hypothetical protein
MEESSKENSSESSSTSQAKERIIKEIHQHSLAVYIQKYLKP